MTVNTTDLVATVAYLIGVRKDILEQYYGEESRAVLDELYADENATTVRYLCSIRTTLLQKFKETDTLIRFHLKNLYSIEWFDQQQIKQLEKWGHRIIQANYTAEQYVVLINELIQKNIDNCKGLFYDWLNWDYIKDLFVVPDYKKNGVLKKEFGKYMGNIAYYPFQLYMHWEPIDCGNIFFCDGKFLTEIYKMHGDCFIDKSKYKDAHVETKNTIYEFIRRSTSVALVVDCENSDVYKLYGMLKNLDQDEINKIEKIILYDDSHTTCGWDSLGTFTNIPVEHIEVKRVMDGKSLVDINMTAGVCKAHYKDGIGSFILASSDSDFWGLINTLDDVEFLVLYEYSKCSQAMKDALETKDIYYCSMDDFRSDNTQEFKTFVLVETLKKHFSAIVGINGRELARQIYEETKIPVTEREIEAFYCKYIKKLRLTMDADGNFVIDFVW